MNYPMRAPWVLLMLALLAVGGYGQTQVTARSDYSQVAANLERLIDHEVTGKELPAFSIALVDDQQIVSVVGYVLERLKGEPYQQYLQHAVLQPMGLRESSFTPAATLTRNLAKSFMWTYDGRVFPAPTFELGTGPAGNMYSTVTDLGRFLSALFAGGRGAKGTVIKADTLQKMYAPQYSDSSKFSGYGMGFALLGLNDHRVIAHRGGVYGFSTELLGMPDDHLGVVAITNMDSSSEVTWHLAYTALKFMLAVREHKPLPPLRLTTEIPEETKQRLPGQYGEGDKAVEILDRSGRLYIEALGDGQRTELRQLGDHLVTDDRNGWGWEIIPALNAIKTIGYTEDTLNRVPSSQAAPVPQEWRNLMGEYGWGYDTQYVGERNGALTLLMEWMEYIPLKKISGDVWEFPENSSYDHEKLTFVRDQSGCPTQFKVGGVSFPRRTPCHGPDGQLSRDSDLFK